MNKWLIALATIFILASIVVNIIEYNDPTGDPDPIEVGGELRCTTATCYLDSAINSFNMVAEGELTQIWPAIGNFMTAFGHMLIWDYNFLRDGAWQILRWGILFPVSLGLIFAVAMELIGLLGSLASALGGIIGRLRI